MNPQRIQRKRTKGWRAPYGAVYVGRPSVWGNPFQVFRNQTEGFRRKQIERYRGAILGGPLGDRVKLERYTQMHGWHGGFSLDAIRTRLRGRDLMCWCPLDRPCHADVLLELANN